MRNSLKGQSAAFVTKQMIHYIEHDPGKNFAKLLKAAHTLTSLVGIGYEKPRQAIEEAWNDPEHPYHTYAMRFFTELDPKVREKAIVNFMVNASLVGYAKQKKLAEKYDCNIPLAILMDPTSACNLKCIGCWAAEYEKQDNLSLDELDSIITQGKELGIYFFLFSGGEPMIRREDLLKLCRKHDDCIFAAFTNGTLIDEACAEQIREAGNFTPIISIEGSEEETDKRRGKGTYAKALRAMELLNAHHVAFGFSACYHSGNIDTVASDAFIDLMIQKGAWFGWYFTYIPVGSDAHVELMVSAEQRAYMYRRINEIRRTKPMLLVDFWNDGEMVSGCIAGGRRYFHINSAGDAEPCAFVHYANSNIREQKLLEILRSPLFMQYRRYQPFNKNLLRPCPMLDNPAYLRKMVGAADAHSTQSMDQESAEELTAKTEPAAQKWAEKADELWKAQHGEVVREREKVL